MGWRIAWVGVGGCWGGGGWGGGGWGGGGLAYWLQGPMGGVVEAGKVPTWTPKVRRIIAFWAIVYGFGSLFYLLWGFR